MGRRIHISFLLLLSVVATGAQWDVLQTFAWGRMLANYSRSMPFSEAVSRTFNGEMCDICQVVATAKRQERSASDAPDGRIETKIVLFFQPVPRVVVPAPCLIAWTTGDRSLRTEARSAPPVPPPRYALA